MQGNYAIPGKIIDTFFFPTDYISNEDLKVFMHNYIPHMFHTHVEKEYSSYE